VVPPSGSGDLRILNVEVVEARNLIACTKSGDSDPHLSLFLTDLGMREIKSESFKTKPQTKTLAPKWRENFSFGMRLCHSLTLDGFFFVCCLLLSLVLTIVLLFSIVRCCNRPQV
jgi:Ca2+-dependent lipid-binding protein